MTETELASWTMVGDKWSLASALEQLAAGEGPYGIDTERASGFRYSNRAFLVQVFRRGSGTFIFDPTKLDSMLPLAELINPEEWILHSADQDLPSLAELGLKPERLFDTELASRLLGFERVGLGAVTERLLDIQLAKAHSAVDWSTRPLPIEWLEYAALDVIVLPDLRDAVYRELEASDKVQIAHEEFEAVRTRPPKPVNDEPWRKLSGGNKLRGPRQLAVARELWNARDRLAREKDVAPGRLVPDASLIAAVAANPRSKGELAKLETFRGRASRTELNRWWDAILAGKTTRNVPGPRPRDPDAIPHHRSWEQKAPEAAVRLAAARAGVEAEAESQNMPLENLITPSLVRRVAWNPPSPPTPENIAARLAELGARPWQIARVAPIISAAFVDLG